MQTGIVLELVDDGLRGQAVRRDPSACVGKGPGQDGSDGANGHKAARQAGSWAGWRSKFGQGVLPDEK
jgi:hypothetical protein